MSVKLSELLETSALCISSMADDHRIRKSSGSGEQRLLTRARALRAIAPALVVAMKDAVERHIEVDDWNLCPACRFEHILEEAGVTCE